MSEKICECYKTRKETYHRYNSITGEPIQKEKEIGVCFGTKECEKCNCEGNRKNCDFYEHIRNE